MAKNNEYKVLQGIDYPPAKRAEVGDVVSDLPKESISWLIACGAIISTSKVADADLPVLENTDADVPPLDLPVEAPVEAPTEEVAIEAPVEPEALVEPPVEEVVVTDGE